MPEIVLNSPRRRLAMIAAAGTAAVVAAPPLTADPAPPAPIPAGFSGVLEAYVVTRAREGEEPTSFAALGRVHSVGYEEIVLYGEDGEPRYGRRLLLEVVDASYDERRFGVRLEDLNFDGYVDTRDLQRVIAAWTGDIE